MREAPFPWIDAAVVVLYFIAMVGIGIYFARRQKDTSEFLLASRNIGWVAIGLSLLSALNSASDYIIGPAAYMEWGIVLLVGLPVTLLTFLIGLKIFVPFYQSLQIYNCYEYLEYRFHVAVRVIASVIFILWRIGWMGVTLYLPAYVLNVVMGVALIPTIIILGVITTAYATLGGARAVIWTDVIQALIMLSGIIFTVFIIVGNVPGGFLQVWQTSSDAGFFRLSLTTPGMEAGQSIWENISLYFHHPITIWSVIFITIISTLTTYGADHVMIQRYLSARSLADCKRGFVLNYAAGIVYTLFFVALSMALLTYFKINPLPAGQLYESYFPYFISEKMPVAFRGLLIAAIYAAAQSSASAGISSATSVIFTNFYVRLVLGQVKVDEHASGRIKKQHLLFSKVCSLSLGVAVTALACVIPKLGTLFSLFNKIVASFAGVMIPVFLLAMFSHRTRSFGVSIGAICGLIAMGIWGFGHQLGLYEKELGYGWTAVVGFIVTLTAGYTVSLFQRGSGDEQRKWLWKNVVSRKCVAESEKYVSV